MYKIQVNYSLPIFNNFDIMINNIHIDSMKKRKTCIVNVPHQHNTLQITHRFINSQTITVQDQDTVFVSIHPSVYLLWGLFTLLMCIGLISFLLLVFTILITWKYGFHLRVASYSNALQFAS